MKSEAKYSALALMGLMAFVFGVIMGYAAVYVIVKGLEYGDLTQIAWMFEFFQNLSLSIFWFTLSHFAYLKSSEPIKIGCLN